MTGFAPVTDIERYGGAVALVDEAGATVTYAQLAARADAFAERLGGERRLVLIEAANDVDTLVALLGTLRGGHVALPAAPGASADALRRSYMPSAVARGQEVELPDAPAAPLHPDLALLLSTSGSTGSPKLVRLSLENLQANARSIATYLAIGPSTRAITTLPPHYSYGLSVLTSHIVAGGSVVLTDRSVVEPGFQTLCEAAGATAIAGVPYTYQLLKQAGFLHRLPPAIRTLTQAGGRLPPELVEEVATVARAHGARFFVMYGQTEATARMAYLPPDRTLEASDAIGVAIPDGRFDLLDDDGAPVAGPEAVGELVYSGPNVMLGYAQAPADLAHGREVERLHTGDLARLGEDGLYRIVGRRSRFAKLVGLRIGFDEVERLFAGRGLTAYITGDDAMLAVLLPEGADPAVEGDWLADRLSIPRAVLDVATGPAGRLASGKIDYAAIRAAALARRADAAPPATARSVLALYAQAFPRRSPGPDDSFLDMGGDSLTYVTVSMGLEELLGRAPEGWEAMPIAALDALPRADAAPARAWTLRPMDSEILIRALAILAVVVNHASDRWAVGGGANVLLLLLGYNLARYQRGHLAEGRPWRPLAGFARNILVPYYALMLLVLGAKRSLDLPTLFLAGNFAGRFHTLLEPYWFLELSFQCLLILTLLFLPSRSRGWLARWPGRCGAVVLGAAIAVALAAELFAPRPALAFRTPDFLFWLVALGFCVALARGRAARLAVVGIAAAMSAFGATRPEAQAYLSAPSQILWLTAAIAVMVWLPRIVVPAALRATLRAVAGASFAIYLTHNIVVHLFLFTFRYDDLALILLTSVLTGLAVRRAMSWRPRGRARTEPI